MEKRGKIHQMISPLCTDYFLFNAYAFLSFPFVCVCVSFSWFIVILLISLWLLLFDMSFFVVVSALFIVYYIQMHTDTIF